MDTSNFDKPLGGTELMYKELMRRLPDAYKERFSIFNYLPNADFTKKTIYWNQLSHDQPAVQWLSDETQRNKIDHFVFVSNWQSENYRKIFGIPGYKSHVIKNACLPLEETNTPISFPIRICYTSTPWRGLDVLLKAWESLQHLPLELHVFSGTKIYGEEFSKSEDSKYKHLYQKCAELKNVKYRGSISNDELRKELPSFHIMAYPCTFEETSCIAVIEALSAGLRVVTSNIGALPETTEGWARTYNYLQDPAVHAKRFGKILVEEIEMLTRGKLTQYLENQKIVFKNRWTWDNRINEWIDYLVSIILKDKSFTARNLWEKQIFKECYVENEYMIEKFKEEDVIIDLGTHIGSFSLLAYEKGSRNVITFEAEKSNYETAVENLPYEGITLNNKAVWRSDEDRETVSFDKNIVDGNTGMGRVVEKGEPVQCIKFDDVLTPHKEIRMLKVDIEGGEYSVLYTSKQIDKIKEIVGEFHEYETNEIDGYAFDREGLKKFLENKGFAVTLKEASWSNKCGFFKAVKTNNTDGQKDIL